MKRSALFLAAYLLSSPVTPTRAAPPALDLKGAVRSALDHSPLVDAANKTMTIKDLDRTSALVKLLPQLDFTGTHGLQNNVAIASGSNLYSSNPTSPWYSALSVNLTENLYDNGVTLTNLSIASLNRDLAQVNYTKARDQLVLDVATIFYQYSQNVALLEVRKKQQDILNKQYQTVKSLYHQGLKTKSDYLRLEIQVQRAEMDQLSAQNSIDVTVFQLQKLLAATESSEKTNFNAVTVEKLGSSVFPVSRPSNETLFDYQVLKIQDQINGKNVDLAERNVWPQVNLTSGVTYSNSNYLNSIAPFSSNHQLTWNALITLQYSLWDWGIHRRTAEAIRLNKEVQLDELNNTYLETQTQVRTLMANIEKIRQNYRLTQALLASEQESYKNLESQYRGGKVTYLDLITGFNSLLDAKLQYYTAYFDVLQNYAKFRFYEGTIYDYLVERN